MCTSTEPSASPSGRKYPNTSSNVHPFSGDKSTDATGPDDADKHCPGGSPRALEDSPKRNHKCRKLITNGCPPSVHRPSKSKVSVRPILLEDKENETLAHGTNFNDKTNALADADNADTTERELDILSDDNWLEIGQLENENHASDVVLVTGRDAQDSTSSSNVRSSGPSGQNDVEHETLNQSARANKKDGRLSDLSTLTPHLQCFVCGERVDCECWDKRVEYCNIDSIYLGPLELHVEMTDADPKGKGGIMTRRERRKRAKKGSNQHPTFTPPTPEERIHQSIHVTGEQNRLSTCSHSATLVMMGLGRDRQWCVDVPLDGRSGKRNDALPLLFDRVQQDILVVRTKQSPCTSQNTDGNYPNPFVIDLLYQPAPINISQHQRHDYSKAKKKHDYWLVLSQRTVGEKLQQRLFADALYVYYSMIKQMIEIRNMHHALFGHASKDEHIIASICFDIASIYELNHEQDEALLFYKKSLDIFSRSQHANHFDIISVHCKCGMMAYASHDMETAEHHFVVALEGTRKRFVGGHDLALSKIYNNLACVQFEKNDIISAFMWWRKSLDLGATSLLDDSHNDSHNDSHKDTASSASMAMSLANLCIAYYKNNELEESASAAEQALSLHREYLKAETFTLRASYSSLAISAKLSGALEVSSSVYKELYEIQKKVLGPTHRGTLRTLALFSESITMLPKSVQASILQRGSGRFMKRRRKMKLLGR